MRRWNFQTSALISAVGFGLLHAPGASTGTGALELGAIMTLFGYLQCVLVRRTARLGPAMIVHSLTNALAILFVLA